MKRSVGNLDSRTAVREMMKANPTFEVPYLPVLLLISFAQLRYALCASLLWMALILDFSGDQYNRKMDVISGKDELWSPNKGFLALSCVVTLVPSERTIVITF